MLMPHKVERKHNRFLWAVKQECVDIDQCNAYQGDKEAALCVGDLSKPRNSVFQGDSGGIKRIKKIFIIYIALLIIIDNKRLCSLVF